MAHYILEQQGQMTIFDLLEQPIKKPATDSYSILWYLFSYALNYAYPS
ncbi:hypothetical protein ACQKII_05315 [Lysinibacillus sp. NPDC048646]